MGEAHSRIPAAGCPSMGCPSSDPSIQAPEGLTAWLAEIGRRIGQSFTPLMTAQFQDYIRLLRKWNEKINLTAILDDEGIAVRHLLDSLTLLPFLDPGLAGDSCSGLHVIDIGSGAGFPGLPLKIVRPELQVILLDSLTKRVRFLEVVIAGLKLEGVTACHGRAEEAARLPEFRDRLDVATARAVAPLPALCEYCLPFIRPGGIFLAMKGRAGESWPDARRAISLLGGELAEAREFDLPGTNMKRTILVIRKIAPTPPDYPRRAGLPEHKPLGGSR